ncbi:DUF5320 domain-containing protein [Caloramator sp. CAR-1]|uniref:DUF5320 domain-containing protein n=1 Tax=Caloramator sp. CAR-1 TaxID=3062777 RepID=UPI0026E3370F|nr:DUF5320 domain-containing protein [Caloramator sp. CAR-1]MDO6353710.1 DUF5320 domain-containing protein [Caloramator sp. CAR-1]
MPRRDGTGPIGRGARSGRGMGYCNGNRQKNNFRGCGLGLGLGRHFGKRFLAGAYNDNEFLKMQKAILEERLNWINKMLSMTNE